MLWAFNTISQCCEDPQPQTISLTLHNCNFASLINCNANIWYVTLVGLWPTGWEPLLKACNSKMTPNNFLQHIDLFFSQSSSEKLPLVNGEWIQRDNVERMEGVGTLSLKCDVFIKPSTLGIRELCERACKMIGRARWDRWHQAGDTAGLMHIWTHRACDSQVWAGHNVEKGSGHKLLFLTRSNLQLITASKGILIFSNRVSLDKISTVIGRS